MASISGTVGTRDLDAGRLELAGRRKYTRDDVKSLKKSAEEFEALFYQIMLKSMRDSISKTKLIDGGNGEDIFRGMLDSEYSKLMSEQRLAGIANAVESQLMGQIDGDHGIRSQMIGKYGRMK